MILRKILFGIAGTLSILSASGQNIEGAWQAISEFEGQKVKSVAIFVDGYQALAVYDAQTGAFLFSNGGTYQLEGNAMIEVVEFNTSEPEEVGKEHRFEITLSENELSIVGDDTVFKRIDSGTPGNLSGAWLISGRMRNGEIQERDTNRPRKTMKILSGTRFQWIAYNTETKEFKGTGGGTYTTIDGRYTENIEFFSRDDARAGASLVFDYEIKDGKWHHSGKSSKGEPMYEVWIVREM